MFWIKKVASFVVIVALVYLAYSFTLIFSMDFWKMIGANLVLTALIVFYARKVWRRSGYTKSLLWVMGIALLSYALPYQNEFYHILPDNFPWDLVGYYGSLKEWFGYFSSAGLLSLVLIVFFPIRERLTLCNTST